MSASIQREQNNKGREEEPSALRNYKVTLTSTHGRFNYLFFFSGYLIHMIMHSTNRKLLKIHG